MKRNRLWLVTVSLLVLLAFGAIAQKTKSQKPVKKTPIQKPIKKTPTQKPIAGKSTSPLPGLAVDSTQNEKKVRDMVAFLEFVLNTLGSGATSSRDKDVLITESYSKIFKDGNVQIEDDLDEEREVITNKNVVAYLKDVDFFFTDVKFEFMIEDVQRGENANNKLFYKVSLKRNLKGTTAEGKPVNNTIPRYIEINYNPDDQDLRIASIYTNEFNEKDALMNWWKQLSLEWQTVFREKLSASTTVRNLTDSLSLHDIKDITSIETLDLSNNKYIQNTEPLAQLTGLKSLNLSKTNIGDLSPIRNLTELVELDLSNTKIQELTPLKYSDKLMKLNISHTAVSDLSVIQKMPKLQYLDVSATNVTDFTHLKGMSELVQLNLEGTRIQNLSPLESLAQMTALNVSSTPIEDLTPLKGLKNLRTLDIDSTRTANIDALSSLENLSVLHANYTMISDIHPLQKLANLERIYCDKTPIKAGTADAFMAANPKVLVVFDTEDMKAWWDTLTSEWQDILSTTARIGLTPTKDELAKITNVDSINLRGRHIDDLVPLRKLLKMRVIIANNTAISDLSPLREHREIKYLDVSETEVSDISVTGKFAQLKVLRADKSKIQNIDLLFAGLQKLYVDQTAIHDITAQEFLERNPHCLLVYKTIHLNRWWNRLPENWKEVFRRQMTSDTSASRENLHELVEQETFHFKEAQVTDLSAFSEFVRLKELHFSGTAITDLSPLIHFTSLKSLHATNSPIQQIELLNQLSGLEDLDISNSPVDELKVIGSLPNLKKLNCSGTQIKKLDPLKVLSTLEYLDCSNTRVGNLDPVSHRSLKTLKCYNTKVSTREIENFKKGNPECSVVYYR